MTSIGTTFTPNSFLVYVILKNCKKLKKIANNEIFEKKIVFSFSSTKDVFKTEFLGISFLLIKRVSNVV